MALSELPPQIDEGGEAGAEAPLMRTPPPGPMSRAWLTRLRSVDAPWTDARRARRAALTGMDDTPIVLATGRGANVFDLDGNRYVDLAGAFGAALLGHGNTRVARAMELQSARLTFGLGDVYASDAKIGLTERLARLFPEPGARVMLGLSGADAIDAAIKTALLTTGRPGVLAFEGAYHGLAMGPLATCGLRPAFRAPFAPHLTPHVRFAPYPSGSDVLDESLARVQEALASGEVGCVLVEPVLGRGGVVVPPTGFLRGLRELCDRRGALLVADEIWTGLGRSGAVLRIVDEGVTPDLVCLGKGLGGGLPISACVGRGAVMDSWRSPAGRETAAAQGVDVGDEMNDLDAPSGEAIHTSTHAGNPLACACAIAVLDSIVGMKLHLRAAEEGAALLAALKTTLGPETHVRDVRGVGLMIGVELEGDAPRGIGMMRDLLMKGYLVLTGGRGDVITITPPLTTPRPLLDDFVESFAALAALRAV